MQQRAANNSNCCSLTALACWPTCLPQELLHKTGLGGRAADVNWFDAGNNTFWAPKETLIAIRCVCHQVPPGT